jgi:hypothetical protein
MLPYIKIKQIFSILIIMTLAISIVVAIAWKANLPISKNNGFKRSFDPLPKKLIAVSGRQKDITGIIGATKHSLYFRLKEPNKLLVLNRPLTFPHYLSLNLPENKVGPVFNSFVDSPLVRILLGNSHAVISGNLIDPKLQFQSLSTPAFSHAVPISDYSFILRVYEQKAGKLDQIFAKASLSEKTYLPEKSISNQQGDAGISNDGWLSYDTKTHLTAYVFFYRNGFIALDTNLNLTYKGKTIDTLYSYQTKAAGFANADTKMFTNYAPSRIINMANCVDNGRLYNWSLIKADNENSSSFNQNTVIDVYNLQNGIYEGSFYIPAYKEEKPEQFRVFDGLIIVLYKSYIITYQLNS